MSPLQSYCVLRPQPLPTLVNPATSFRHRTAPTATATPMRWPLQSIHTTADVQLALAKGLINSGQLKQPPVATSPVRYLNRLPGALVIYPRSLPPLASCRHLPIHVRVILSNQHLYASFSSTTPSWPLPQSARLRRCYLRIN